MPRLQNVNDLGIALRGRFDVVVANRGDVLSVFYCESNSTFPTCESELFMFHGYCLTFCIRSHFATL